MVYAIFGLALGIALGAYLPVFPQVYSKLVAVAFMASLDAGFGGLRAVKEGTYDSSVFISGFCKRSFRCFSLLFWHEIRH